MLKIFVQLYQKKTMKKEELRSEKTENVLKFITAIGNILAFKILKCASETISKSIYISIQSLLSVRRNCKQNAN